MVSLFCVRNSISDTIFILYLIFDACKDVYFVKKTLVVNFVGAPGSGKSTLMAAVFAELKWRNIDCEIVTEFAKDLVWDERFDDMKDEIYIFAKQNHRLFRVNGKVDVIITDRPLLLTILYNNRYGGGNQALDNLVIEEFNKYNNLNYLLKRVNKYNPIGRVQTEEESDEIAVSIKEALDTYMVNYIECPGSSESVKNIVDEILCRIDKEN